MKLPQLSLRDLFWLVALVAMGCGWWVDRNKQAEETQYFKGLVRTQETERWHFDVAASLLKHLTGDIVTVEETGVMIKRTNGTTAVYLRSDPVP